jgi:hypothetical protein
MEKILVLWEDPSECDPSIYAGEEWFDNLEDALGWINQHTRMKFRVFKTRAVVIKPIQVVTKWQVEK